MATMTASTTMAFGNHGVPRGPEMIDISHGAAPPPGVFRMSSAVPAQTNDIASVTTMSGTFVTTTRAPLIAPTTSPSPRTATTTPTPNRSPWPFIRTAEVTLASAIIEPTDRSMPPEMTTIVWATAANAIGRIAIARPWIAAGP